MFDKSKFDHILFNKSVVSDSTDLPIDLYTHGGFELNLIVSYPIPILSIVGSSTMNPGLTPRLHSDMSVNSVGAMSVTTFILRMEMSCDIQGYGDSFADTTVKIPFGLSFDGSSTFDSSREYVLQEMVGSISGSRGSINADLVAATDTGQTELSGNSSFNVEMLIELPLSIDFPGSTDLHLLLSNLDEDIFQIKNLHLLPGQTIIIDTDALSVLINNVEDVSNITTDSVFFELAPTDNELTFQTIGETDMSVTAIWKNRWL